VLVPTKTTRTAAYVAAEINASTLLTFIHRERTEMKSMTEADTVIKLLFLEGPNDMINIGPMRNKPPTPATTKRVNLSTKAETSLGDFLSLYSVFRASRAFWDHVIHAGRRLMKNKRMASMPVLDSLK
jgi:hypothetical protein